jgi:hypothetical protein
MAVPLGAESGAKLAALKAASFFIVPAVVAAPWGAG